MSDETERGESGEFSPLTTQDSLPPLPPEHVRPSLDAVVALGYKAEDYEKIMLDWEHEVRVELGKGRKYEDIVDLTDGEDSDAEPPIEEPAPAAEAPPAETPKPAPTRPSVAYAGYHENTDGTGAVRTTKH